MKTTIKQQQTAQGTIEILPEHQHFTEQQIEAALEKSLEDFKFIMNSNDLVKYGYLKV